MRRLGFLAVTSLAIIAIAVPSVDARHGAHHQATVTAKTSAATQGSALHILAKVKHGQRGASFSASATVHFASGDKTVHLKRRGSSFTATANVAVNSNETPGTVPVDVTVEYNDDEQEVETEGTVEAGDDQGDDQGEQADPSCDPAQTAGDCGDDHGGDDSSPEPTESPETGD